ncbi:uncharacterized protein PHACADRAFT_253355 [Phanerochaete carnosa HHB-10118-sp]|uniref:Uncharacterized protein n=1 Tax=Phanerochaete carnosa (strain HHB-10118-sp) TaxID=650164 RepID=K5X0N3_PHACS|nr:uncharacterized protein PHACADRAFT_253355 [Phanerochaete carnosa HHB-10118-sp]EKM56297.1 hypothetical protein PHACADRAFT_253355 [Phanerochaete carnosa HHB-10118-sp]
MILCRLARSLSPSQFSTCSCALLSSFASYGRTSHVPFLARNEGLYSFDSRHTHRYNNSLALILLSDAQQSVARLLAASIQDHDVKSRQSCVPPTTLAASTTSSVTGTPGQASSDAKLDGGINYLCALSRGDV